MQRLYMQSVETQRKRTETILMLTTLKIGH